MEKKYLKYKNKYIILKKRLEGGANEANRASDTAPSRPHHTWEAKAAPAMPHHTREAAVALAMSQHTFSDRDRGTRVDHKHSYVPSSSSLQVNGRITESRHKFGVNQLLDARSDFAPNLANLALIYATMQPHTFSDRKNRIHITVPANGILQVNDEIILTDIKDIIVGDHLCAALEHDGKVTVWDHGRGRGDSPVVPDEVKRELATDVKNIYGNGTSFVAIKEDNSVVLWGDRNNGGYLTNEQKRRLEEKTITSVVTTNYAFAALQENGQVTVWGASWFGGPFFKIDNAKKIIGTLEEIYVLLKNGNVWKSGHIDGNRSYSNVNRQLHDVDDILYDTKTGQCTAVKKDKSTVKWDSI